MEQIQDNIDFADYWHIIKNRKNVILIFFFTVVFVVTAGSFLMRPVYQATVLLLVDIENPKVLSASGTIALSGTDYYAYKEYLQSQTEILQSRTIARQVFDEFKLANTKEYINAKDPVKDFLKTIDVEPIRDTRLLRLNVKNRDPKLAADIANLMAEIYVERNLAYITKSEVINLLKNEYLQFQAKLSEYSKVYKDKHPKMIRLKQEMAQMAERIRAENDRAGIARPLPIESSSEGTGILADVKSNNISIQDRADVPRIPIKPKKRLNILLSMIMGLFGGVGIAFLFEYMDDSVKSIEDLERTVDWPFLGNVPTINGKDGMSELDKDLFVKIKPNDPASEAYRAIRTSVIFSSTDEHLLKSIIVTSPGPQEGKTTTLCNLGMVMAQSGKKVLLIDADMRKPRLHDIFKIKNEVGLSSFLSGQAESKDLIHKSDIENLWVVPGGPHSPNTSELLTSHKMKEFIETAQSKFDFILLDTPPIAVVTDALILSKITSGTIIVIEGGKTSKRILPRVNQMLKDTRVKIAGAILNKLSANSSNYYSSYYYSKVQ